MPKVGDVIGRFSLERVLGRGPMSEVFLAVEEGTGWKAAFKTFLLEPGSRTSDHAQWADRMQREARHAASFQHPNVVAIHEVGELGGAPYLVRDFIEGRPLAEYVTDCSPGSFERKRDWLLELARTLADIHRAGLVHRHVKPTNVLIRRDGALRVLDFGVARRSLDREAGLVTARPDRTPTPGAVRVVGTPAYMAPERFAHKGTSQVADQFGWGVLAYELLAGRLPWGDGKRLRPVKTIESILTEDPPSARAFVPRLSVALDELLARTMAKEPRARFASMDEVVRAFEAAAR
ncbi:MAG TPA: serine/threonine-protein kinase [Polyangiaceae bacterium]|jgi:serine/threonine-protein kinase